MIIQFNFKNNIQIPSVKVCIHFFWQFLYMAIFRKNIPTYNKCHLHKFHLQSDKDLDYGLVGHDKVLQFDMLVVNILRNICINFRVAIPENLQSNDGRCMFPCQQRIPPRPQGTVAWLKT